MNYKITGGQILLYTDNGLSVVKSDIHIRDEKISFVPFEENETYEVFDAADKLVMPGIINMHTHAYMTLMRNYADDIAFDEWLFKRIMPVEDRLPKEAAYWTSLLAYIEMIKTGTTSFVDMHMFRGQSALAAKEAGMRGFIGRGLVGDDLYGDGYSRFEDTLEEKKEFECETIKFILSPHAVYSCSPKLLEQVAEESKKLSMLKQIHVSESINEVQNCIKAHGKTPIRLLADTGFLDSETILAHCVHLQDDDIELIKKSGATIVTNPASNAKLGNGFAPIPDIQSKGINLCIGTDGPASNNTLNMFREIGLLSLIHKGISGDSTTLSSEYIIECATTHAAKALGQENELGVIKEGAKADIIMIDLNAVSLFPNNNIISSLCNSANGSEVSSVMIGGKFVMKDGELLTIDKERVYYEVKKVAEAYL